MNQLYKMARECLERGQDIFNTARREQRPLALFRLATPSPTMSPTLPNHQFPPSQPPQAPQTHLPPQAPQTQLTRSLKGNTATLPPQVTTRSAPQGQGGRSFSSSNTLPGRTGTWPTIQRGAGQVGGRDFADGVSGGPVGAGGGAGRQRSVEQQNQQNTG